MQLSNHTAALLLCNPPVFKSFVDFFLRKTYSFTNHPLQSVGSLSFSENSVIYHQIQQPEHTMNFSAKVLGYPAQYSITTRTAFLSIANTSAAQATRT